MIVDKDKLIEIDIQDLSNQEIIKLISSFDYALSNRSTTTKVLTNARLNIGTLRELTLRRDNNQCLLCEISDKNLLICSHIKPCKTGESRLDMNNVLSLCALHDALFDKGYISFSDNGSVLYSDKAVLNTATMKVFIEKSEHRLKLSISDKR